jgi:hypothetical protein
LQTQLWPLLKDQGFEQRGFVYHRFRGVVTAGPAAKQARAIHPDLSFVLAAPQQTAVRFSRIDRSYVD